MVELNYDVDNNAVFLSKEGCVISHRIRLEDGPNAIDQVGWAMSVDKDGKVTIEMKWLACARFIRQPIQNIGYG